MEISQGEELQADENQNLFQEMPKLIITCVAGIKDVPATLSRTMPDALACSIRRLSGLLVISDVLLNKDTEFIEKNQISKS